MKILACTICLTLSHRLSVRFLLYSALKLDKPCGSFVLLSQDAKDEFFIIVLQLRRNFINQAVSSALKMLLVPIRSKLESGAFLSSKASQNGLLIIASSESTFCADYRLPSISIANTRSAQSLCSNSWIFYSSLSSP